MGFIELLLVGAGLSMDAFAVAVCKGLEMRKINYRHAALIAVFFGVFQAAMPLIGWALGRNFESYISAFDHWIAFILLGFIGGKMIIDALRGSGSSKPSSNSQTETARLDIKELVLLAVATSIDALAVGITFAFLKTDIVPSIAVIGVTTLILSFAGVVIGNKFGSKFEKNATLAGGVILILIGTKILIEHLI